MNNKVEISVIIPVFNCENFILKCLKSLECQDFTDFEVLIIDDGSTDSTPTLCKRFISKKTRFKYYQKTNGGVSSARNYGLSLSSGNYLMFIDADDVISQNCLSSLHKIAKEKNLDLVLSNTKTTGKKHSRTTGSQNQKITPVALTAHILNPQYALINFGLKYDSSRSVWGKLYCSDIIKKHKIIFDEKIHLFEDGFFNLNYLKYAKHIWILGQTLYYYNQNDGKSASTYRPNLERENTYKIQAINDFIENNHSELKLAKKIYYLDLFSDFIIKFINNKKTNLTYIQKRAKVREVIRLNLYELDNFSRMFKYLNLKKKILAVLLKLKLYDVVLLLMRKSV